MLVVISFLYFHFVVVVVVVHLSMFFIHILFSTSSLTLPWTITRFLHLFCTFSQPIAEWFATLSFSTIPLSSYRERYGFECAFFTQRRFLPYAPSRYFWHNLLLSRPPWETEVPPWRLQGFILILETQTRPICLFDSQ